MSVLYTYDNGAFMGLNDIIKKEKGCSVDGIYVNLTNQCPCNCAFCIRNETGTQEQQSLWLSQEPSVKEIIEMFSLIDLHRYKEIIFCGFGEPFTRLQDLLEVSKYLKAVSDVKIRINTNGLGNLINKRDVPPLLANTIDSVSISLNASSAEKYLQLTNSIYGMQSYQALLNFAVGCKKYIKEVRLTVVDIVGEEELEQCRKVCDRYDLPLTIRKFR